MRTQGLQGGNLRDAGRTVGTTGLNPDYSLGGISPLPDGYAAVFTVARFNVTSLGIIDI